MSRSYFAVSFFYGYKKCYVRNLTTRKIGLLPHFYCYFYEKMKWLDTCKMPQCSSHLKAKIENLQWRLPLLFWQALRDSSSQVITL